MSVDNLLGLSSNSIKQVPPLKIKGIPTLAIASSSPNAYTVFSNKDGSFPLISRNR